MGDNNIVWAKITSNATHDYNCIAWAAGDDKKWWDPDGDFYWPENVPREHTISAYASLFSTLGFKLCENDFLEHGFHKIAIFENASGASHVARQLPDGSWTSKLGSQVDIQHNLKEDLKNDPFLETYGRVSVLMKKPK